MKYDMTKPCGVCPFSRAGLKLSKERARELGGQIVNIRGEGGRPEFPCHKTATIDDEGGFIGDKDSQHCAGALIFAEKQDAPTQMMRLAERFGFYDRSKLDMGADVFDDLREMIAAGGKRARR